MLSSTDNKQYPKAIISGDIFPVIMEMATATAVVDLMIEITWILSNLTSLEDDNVIEYILTPDFNLLGYLGEMLNYDQAKVKEHAIWSLSNLISSNNSPFEKIFGTGIIDHVSEIVSTPTAPLGLLRVVAWCISNMAKCTVRNFEFISSLVEMASTLLYVSDEEIAVDSIYAFKHLTDVEEEDEKLENDKQTLIAEVEIMDKLMSFVIPQGHSFQSTLRIVGNLSSGNNDKIHEQIVKTGFFGKSKYYFL